MPLDLWERSSLLADALLGFCGMAVAGTGSIMATDLLDSGVAWRKSETICKAQGGLRIPGEAVFRRDVVAEQNGIVTHIDNHHLARIVKLVDAPVRRVVGVQMYVRLWDQVNVGQSLFMIHAQASGELEYSSAYVLAHAVVGLPPIGAG